MEGLALKTGLSASLLYKLSKDSIPLTEQTEKAIERAISDHSQVNEANARAIRTLHARLGISHEKLSQMLKTTDAELDRYKSGEVAVPAEVISRVHIFLEGQFLDDVQPHIEAAQKELREDHEPYMLTAGRYPPVLTSAALRQQIREHADEIVKVCGNDLVSLGWAVNEIRQSILARLKRLE